MPDPTRPIPTTEPLAPWLLGHADLTAIREDDALLDALAAGREPDELGELGALLAAWLDEVPGGDAR
jgi:hypothetical protein